MENNLKSLNIIKLAHKERLTDRYSETQIIPLEHKGQPIALVSFVEILSRWNPAREIGISLPQNFAHFFNRSSHQSILTRFEDALKNINNIVTLANQKIDSPISAIIAIHVGNEVYFSNAGETKIVLIRNGKPTTVSAGSKEDSSTEFATVTSGELSAVDKMCYGNDEFLTLCKQLIVGSDDIDKQLLGLLGAEGTVETGAIVSTAPDNNGEIKTLYVNDRSPSIPMPKLNFTRVNTVIALAASGIKKNFASFVQWIRATIDAWRDKKAAKPKAVITEKDISDDPSPKNKALKKQFNFRMKLPSFNRPKALRLRLPKLSATGAIGAIILLVLAAGAGYAVDKAIKAHGQKAAPAVAEVPALIADLQKSPVAAIPAVIASELTQDRYRYLSSDQITTLNTLAAQANITITQPSTPLFSLPTTTAFVATTPKNDLVYAIDLAGQLYSWDGKTLTTMKQATAISAPISMTALAKNRVVVADSQANLYLFDGSDKQPVKITQPTSWATGNRYVQSYNGNLYVLTISDGIVHKIPGFVSDIANDTTLVKTTPVTDDHLLSFLINGDINTLTSKTGLVSHPKTGSPKTVIVPDLLATNSTASFGVDNVAVNSGNLVSYYSEQGLYQSGKAIVASDKISQVISYGSNRMLIVIGSNVYLLP